LLELAKQLGNVSQACKMLGYSRDSFYRFKELYDKGGDLALAEMSRRKPILANRTPLEIEAQIIALSLELPAFGQIRVSNELRKRGLSISPAGRARRLVSETVRGRTSAAFRRSSRPSGKGRGGGSKSDGSASKRPGSALSGERKGSRMRLKPTTIWGMSV
jgi:hypothetical protein